MKIDLNKELKRIYNKVIISEYLYICDEELENRNIYVNEVTNKQEELAQEFRVKFSPIIDKNIENKNIELHGDFYEPLTPKGKIFIEELNLALVELSQKQSEIKSPVKIDLELEVELDTNNYENLPKIIDIITKYGTVGNLNEIKSTMASNLYKKTSDCISEIDAKNIVDDFFREINMI